MKRLFLIPLNAVTAVSLLLCVAVSALWVRSYWRADAFAWRDAGGGGGVAGVRSNRGSVSYLRMASMDPVRYRFPSAAVATGYMAGEPYAGPPSLAPDWQFAGFGRARGTAFAMRLGEWTVPHWFLSLAAAGLPGTYLARQVRRRRRDRAGRCPHCDYDLRASPERCPECGAGIA